MNFEEIQQAANFSPEHVAALLALPPKDLADLATLSPEQAMLVAQGYAEAEADKEVSGWDTFLTVVKVLTAVAGAVSPIAGAVSAVLGAVNAAKTV